MLQYRINKCVFKSLQKLSLMTLRSLKLSGNEFQPTGQQQRKSAGHTFATSVVEEPGVVDWQTWDAAEKDVGDR